ncbi:Uncharacterised protein [Klebsiella pneumoniae]|nr:Uncharacterised protein [Klebsiella pneumoniae]STU67933.1 Uncharacterised protein [Klebsiella pneumoniae]
MTIAIAIITASFLHNTVQYATFYLNASIFKSLNTYLYFFNCIQFKTGNK